MQRLFEQSVPGQATAPRGTKLVCSIGPASVGCLRELIDAGLDVARVNFSHGTIEEWRASVAAVRRAAAEAGRTIAVMADLSGPKVRLGDFRTGEAELATGAAFTLRTTPGPGDASGVSVSYAGLVGDLQAGDRVLLADGAAELRVVDSSGTEVHTLVVRGGLVRSRAGLNAPSEHLSLAGLTSKDRRDARTALELGVDLLAQSFVRRPEDVIALRNLLGPEKLPIVAKIETGAAIAVIDDIIDASDAIMVARGDLGVEIPFEEVPRLQKLLLSKTLRAGCPSIVATQMLESMVAAPRPTRAEASDVANAVLDGADAVMLSAETAIGAFPVEAAAAAVRIIEAIEPGYGGEQTAPAAPRAAARVDAATGPGGVAPVKSAVPIDREATPVSERGAVGLDRAEPVIWAAADLARREAGVRAIGTFTRSGRTAELLSALRPGVPILALSPDPASLRRLALRHGVIPRPSVDAHGTDEIIALIDGALRDLPFTNAGDPVLVVASSPSGAAGSNLLELHRLG